jgi:hypothetical protein
MPGLESRSLALGLLSNTEREADGLGSTVREGGGGATGDLSSRDFMVRQAAIILQRSTPLVSMDSIMNSFIFSRHRWFAWT